MKTSDVDALARLLDGDAPDPGAVTDQTRTLVAVATALQPRPVRAPSEFKAELRDTLLASHPPSAYERALLTWDRTTERWRYSTRVAAASAAAALALSTGGVAVAATQAMPGNLLYPVKLTLEDLRLMLVRDPAVRGVHHLDHAEIRVHEARHAAEADDHPRAARALREGDTSTRSGAQALLAVYAELGDTEALDQLATFSRHQRARIGGLSPLLRAESAVAAADSLVVLDRIDARLAVLREFCPACGERGSGRNAGSFDVTYIPPADEDFDACPCAPRAQAGAKATPLAPAAPDVVQQAVEPAEPSSPPPSAPAEDVAPEPRPAPEAEPGDDPPPQSEPSVVDEVLEEVIRQMPPLPEPLGDETGAPDTATPPGEDD
jgi:hypothetical protein